MWSCMDMDARLADAGIERYDFFDLSVVVEPMSDAKQWIVLVSPVPRPTRSALYRDPLRLGSAAPRIRCARTVATPRRVNRRRTIGAAGC